jgi:hypothetical protein
MRAFPRPCFDPQHWQKKKNEKKVELLPSKRDAKFKSQYHQKKKKKKETKRCVRGQ